VNLKNVIDNPYLAPVMTPLKWIGACMAFTMGPYYRAAKAAQQNKTHNNPFLNYFDKMMDEADMLVCVPAILGAIGGLAGGITLSTHLLAGAGIIGGIMGGLAVTSAVLATSVVAAPVLCAVAIASATLVAATSVTAVPGFLYGLKTTADHVFKRGPVPAPATAPAPSTMEQLTAQLSAMNEAEQQQLLNQLRNKAGNDFGASAAPATDAVLDKDIAVSKTIKLKNQPN